MILYYSATGNCKYVAKLLAEALGEGEPHSMLDRLSSGELSFEPVPGEAVGLVTPTYFGGIPLVVADFARRATLTLPEGAYVYHVATFGTTTGAASAMLAELLAKGGVELVGRFGVRMADTWTPTFDLSDKERVRTLTDAAKPQVGAIAERVRERFVGNYHNRRLPLGIVRPVYDARYHDGAGGSTDKFSVGDACIGCSLCARKCPSAAIEMRDGRPMWIKETCNLCLGCLHRCPKFAIQYGPNTARHGQFQNPYERV